MNNFEHFNPKVPEESTVSSELSAEETAELTTLVATYAQKGTDITPTRAHLDAYRALHAKILEARALLENNNDTN